MNRNEKRKTGIVTAMAVVLLALTDIVGAQDVQYQPAQQVQPVFESEKAWKFKDDNLVFFNASPNAGGIRYIRWKDYTWVITPGQITVIDERPYGTQLQGQRGLLTEDGQQKDKDLMNDLKRQAGDIRKSRDPYATSSTDMGVGFGLLGLGIGLGFLGNDDHHHHHGHGYRPPPPRSGPPPYRRR